MTDDILEKIVLLLVSGLTRAAIDEAGAKLGLTPDEIGPAIAEARLRIAIAASCDRHEVLGAAVVRLNDIYRRALAIQDTKTALAAQKELSKLLGLYRLATSAGAAASREVTSEVEAARRHLAPLGLGDETTPLAELCRRAVLRVLRSGADEQG